MSKSNANTIPKWITELYSPTPEKWQAWLDFRDATVAALSAPDCDWRKACAIFDSCPTTHGMGEHHSSSQTARHKHPFLWAILSKCTGDLSRSVGLCRETSDSDLRDLAEYRED